MTCAPSRATGEPTEALADLLRAPRDAPPLHLIDDPMAGMHEGLSVEGAANTKVLGAHLLHVVSGLTDLEQLSVSVEDHVRPALAYPECFESPRTRSAIS